MPVDVVRLLREAPIARAEYRRSLTSTNDRAAQRAAEETADLPLLVVADEQTAGRGRGGNRWWTGPGALAFSLLVDAQTVAASENRSPLVALAAAVGVVDAVAPLLPGHDVGLHWPNDIYAAGGKLAGILVEVLSNRRHIIGIGVNTNNTAAHAPPELHASVATMRDLAGRSFDQTDVLIELLNGLDREFARLRANPSTIAQRANDRCLQRGRTLSLRWANRTVTGCCRGIAPTGAILLETAAGDEAFLSGTVQ